MKNTQRRDFLKFITNTFFGLSGLLGLGGLARFFSYHPDPGPQTEFDLGSTDEYPVGQQIIRLDIPAIIVRIDEGFKAISLVCTHLGCTVETGEESGEFICPCHGSRYNKDGNLLEGPATKDLPRYRIEQREDGTLRLFTV